MIKTIKVSAWVLAANCCMYGVARVVKHYPEPTFVALSLATWCVAFAIVCFFHAVDEAVK